MIRLIKKRFKNVVYMDTCDIEYKEDNAQELLDGYLAKLNTMSLVITDSLGFAILVYSISSLFLALSNALSRGTGHIGLYSLSNFFVSITIILLNLILILCFHQDFYALLISACSANFVAAMFVLTKLKFWSCIN